MWWLAPCLLLVSAVTVADARHGCTTCPSNACSQNEAHIGFCNDENYVSEAYYCTYGGSRLESRTTYYSCWWSRCSSTVYYYVFATRYQTCYRRRLACQRRCCSGFQLNGGNCEPYCTGGCQNGGVCIDPEECECPNNWQGQYCDVDVNECDANNGGCSDNCSNSAGSYSCACRQYADLDPDGRHCTCRPGFIQNDTAVTCIDIDECADDNGGCDHDCINTPGSHICECDPGYELHVDLKMCLPICTGGCLNGGECVAPETCNCSMGWTGQNCESDIEECVEGTSGCHQHCTNTVPGYFCFCDAGYTLDEDGHACNDINECITANGECDHLCHNTVGSFYCSCNPGYTLQENGFSCVAQPCPTLYPPLHGGMTCTGEQVTDETCNFTCDPGYELLGSSARLCQPNNTWSGQLTVCNILHCPVLNGNDDTFIVHPCDTAFNSSCMLQCTPGHYYPHPNTNVITCVAGPVHETVVWTYRPECKEIQLCQPNPCLHGGQCSELDDGTSFCLCDETGYKGDVCNIGIVDINPQRIPVLQFQESFNFTVSAKPDRELFADLTVASGWGITIVPPQLVFDRNTTSHQVTITAQEEVITYITVSLSGLDHRQYETPTDVNVVVQFESSTPNYAMIRNHSQGILEPSCCTHPELNYNCVSNDYIVQITSTCKAEENAASVTLPGISFVAGNGIDLPLSLDAVKVDYSYTTERAVSSNVMCTKCNELYNQSSSESFAALHCDSYSSGTPHCYCYRLSSADISEVLSYEGLATTYLQRLSPLLPDWLSITPLKSERIYGHDSYHTSLISTDKIDDELFCSHFLKDRMGRGIHSLLTYHGSLELQIANATVHSAIGHFCVMVDMCEGSESPIHFSLPEGLRPEDDLFFQQWRVHGWQPYFRGMALSLSRPLPIVERYTNDLWNGKNDITIRLDPPHISLNGNLDGFWQVNEDAIELMMIGEFDLHVASVEELFSMGLDQNIQVVLPEASTLTITTAKSSMLRLTAVDEGYMSLNSSADSCSRVILMKLVHSYSEDEDSLLSQVLAIKPQSADGGHEEYSCQVDIALGLSTGADVTGLAMRSLCHDITFNELVFSGFITVLAVGKSGSPAFCGTDYAPDANIELHLWAGSSSDLEMNAFITLDSDNEKPLVIATLDPTSSSYQATIRQAQISVLGTTFTAAVQIEAQELRFNANTSIFEQTPTNLSGTADVTEKWDEMELRLQGIVDKRSELHYRIQLQTRNLLTELASRANDRIGLAELSLDSVRHQLMLVEGYYNDATAVLQTTESRCAQFDSEIDNTEAAIVQLEQDIEANGAAVELQQSLNEVCELRTCGDVCAPGTTCSLCSVPVEIEVTHQCPATCTRTKLVRNITGYEYFTDYTNEVSCGEDGTWVTCIPLQVEPTVFTAEQCFVGLFFFENRCSAYRIPIHGRRAKIENILVEEHYTCTKPCKQLSTSYIVQECCEMDECLSLIPDTTCVKENAACHLARRELLNEMSSTVGSAAYLIHQLDEYHSNLTVLRAQKAQCKVEEQLARQMSGQLLRTLNRLNASAELSEHHVKEVQDIHMAGQELNKLLNFYDINSIFNVTLIDFDIIASVTTGFASVVPLRISYNIPYLNRQEELVTLFEFDFFEASIHNSSEEMSIAVQDILTEGASTRRRKILVPPEDLEGEEYWKAQCENLYEMKVAMEHLLGTLNTARETYLASLHHATIAQNTLSEMAANFTDYSNISSIFNITIFDGVELTEVIIDNIAKQTVGTDAVQAMTTTLNELFSVAGELVAMTAESAFLQWKLEIGHQLNSSVSVYGHRCAGFLDCIITITEVIKNTLEVPQIPEANDLLELLPEAEQDLVKLAFRIDLTLEEAIVSVDKIMYILNTALNLDYWCATVPSVQLDRMNDVILQGNDTIQLECNATTPWSLNYEWQKDNTTIPGATERVLVIASVQLSDAGEYRCIASNHIGSVASVSLGLTVVTPPVVVSHPANFSTYSQSGDQVVLDCDVSGNPPPVISWYMRPPGSQEAMPLPNATSTQLRYPRPEPHQEGWYHCEAANQQGVDQSRKAYIHILNSSVVQFAVPAVVKFSEGKTEEQEPATLATLLNTGINPLIHTTLDEDNSELTGRLTQLIQEHVDMDGVTLLKASTNNPSSPSSISFLVATEVVPIDPGHTTPLAELFENFTMAKDQLRVVVEELNLLLEVLNYTSLGVMLDETDYGGVDLTTAIWRCPHGQGLNTTNYLFCVECLPGEYPAPTTDLKGGSVLYAYPSCTECPKGHYQPLDGQAHCDPCPAGHYQRGTGETACEPCAAGYYQMLTGQDYCLQCPEGSITDRSGATSCRVLTPTGTTSATPSVQPSVQPSNQPSDHPSDQPPAFAETSQRVAFGIGVGVPLVVVILITVLCACVCRKRLCCGKRWKEKLASRKQTTSFDLGEWVTNDARHSIMAQFDTIQLDSELYALYGDDNPDQWEDSFSDDKDTSSYDVAAMYADDIKAKNYTLECNSDSVGLLAEDEQTMENNGESNNDSTTEILVEDDQTIGDNGESNSCDFAGIIANENVATTSETAVDVQSVEDDEVEDSISLQSHTREDQPLV